MFLRRRSDEDDNSSGIEVGDDGTSASSPLMAADDSDLRAITAIQTTTMSSAAAAASLSTTTTIPAAATPTEEPSTSSTVYFDDDASTFVNFSDRVAAGITIGAIVGAFVLAAAIFAFWRHHSRPLRNVNTARKKKKNNNNDRYDDEDPSGKLPMGGGDDGGDNNDNNNNKRLSLDDETDLQHHHQQLHFRIIELPADEITELGGSSRSLALVRSTASVRHLRYQTAASARGWDWHHQWYGAYNLRPYPEELWAGDVGLVGAVVHEMHAPEKTNARSPPTELSAVLYLPDSESSSSRRDMGGPAAVRLGRPLTLRRTRTTAVMEGLGDGLITPVVVVESPSPSPVSQQGTVVGEVSPTGSTSTAAEELISPLSPHPRPLPLDAFRFG